MTDLERRMAALEALIEAVIHFRVHVVMPGDTLSEIAQKYRVSWRLLASVNRLADPHKIFPGEQLRIPYGVR